MEVVTKVEGVPPSAGDRGKSTELSRYARDVVQEVIVSNSGDVFRAENMPDQGCKDRRKVAGRVAAAIRRELGKRCNSDTKIVVNQRGGDVYVTHVF